MDPIENDEDRKKTIAAINSHLEKADRVYKQLVGNKPTLEMLLLKIGEHRADRGIDELPMSGPGSGSGGTGSGAGSGNATSSNNSASTMVNRAIQLLAQRYCTDCKTSFEDLSRIIQVRGEMVSNFREVKLHKIIFLTCLVFSESTCLPQ